MEACLRRGKKSKKRELIDIFTASQEMHVRPKGGNRGIYQHWKMDEVRRNLSPGKVEQGSLPPLPQMFASESQPCSRTYRANKGSAGLAFDWKSIKSVSFLYSIPSEMASFGDLRASLPSRGVNWMVAFLQTVWKKAGVSALWNASSAIKEELLELSSGCLPSDSSF